MRTTPVIPRFTLMLFSLCAITLCITPRTASATSVQEIAHLDGQGESVLQGFGLVIGLPGTGDSGEDLLVARPLAKLLEHQGNAIGSFEELASSKSVAVVIVTCTVGRQGARQSDRFDIDVSAINNPKSLEGGQLFLTPLRGPKPGDPVFAIAEGPLVAVKGNTHRATVRGGANIIRSFTSKTVRDDGSLTLIIEPDKAGWTTSQLIASVINDHRLGLDQRADPIATALDERAVRIVIPEPELAEPANFIADILSIRFDPSLLTLPARVVVDEQEGIIVMTADVEISPVNIAHSGLVVTTVTPPIERNAQNPLVEQGPWSTIAAGARDRERARLGDLLRAFKSLDVPVRDQISILMRMRDAGALHAELVIR